jgi:lipopolysaccharide transport system permease protein/teichoic acid transport system permease protein
MDVIVVMDIGTGCQNGREPIAGRALNVAQESLFLRDTGQVVSMILQFAFWMTPIFWSPKFLTNKTLNLIKLNPVYYIVEGYRESFIYKTWFWEKHYMLTLYFWGVTLFFFFLGAVVFRRLRPHFADVL